MPEALSFCCRDINMKFCLISFKNYRISPGQIDYNIRPNTTRRRSNLSSEAVMMDGDMRNCEEAFFFFVTCESSLTGWVASNAP